MAVTEQITAYISSLPELKQRDMQILHDMIMDLQPDAKLWFLDGINEEGKIVSNPNIGYGHCILRAANGKDRDFYQVGISANTAGISVYFMALADKTYLAKTYADTIGKASLSGYCLKFRSLRDINPDVLRAAIGDGFKTQQDELSD